MLSPYREAQLLGRFCNFLRKSPNFGTPYYTVYIPSVRSFCRVLISKPLNFLSLYLCLSVCLYLSLSLSLSLSLCLCTNQFKYTYNAKYPTYSQHHITLVRVPAPAGGRISTVTTRDNVTPAAAVAHAIGYDICTDNLLVI